MASATTGCVAESYEPTTETGVSTSPILTNPGAPREPSTRSTPWTLGGRPLDPGFPLFLPAARYNAYLGAQMSACADVAVLGGKWDGAPTFGSSVPFCTFVWRAQGTPANVQGLQAVLGPDVHLTRDTCAEINCGLHAPPPAVLIVTPGEGQVACTSCTPLGYVTKLAAFIVLPADAARIVAGSTFTLHGGGGAKLTVDLTGAPVGLQTFSVALERQSTTLANFAIYPSQDPWF